MCAAHAEQYNVSGVVRDFDGNAISGAEVQMKSSAFGGLYTTLTDAQGRYRMRVEAGQYLALESIRSADYGKTRLEFWAWNVQVHSDLTIDVRYHRLEIYGVNVFKVQGGGPGLFAYFRPMSLTRGKGKDMKKDPDIAPLPTDLELGISVDGIAAKVDTVERVREPVGNSSMMYSYLVHFTPVAPVAKTSVVRISGRDKENGDQGEAAFFYSPPEYRK